MLLRMLKKDLLRKKAMNVVLFLLIVLCTTAMAASVSNLFATNAAIDNFARETNIADYYLLTPRAGSNEQAIDDWLSSTNTVSSYRKQAALVIEQDKIHVGGEELVSNGGITLSPVPQGGDYVFNGDSRITQLNDGEIALGVNLARNNGLTVGDSIEVTSGKVTQSLTVAYLMKDMLYGSDFMGFNRAIINYNDYRELAQAAPPEVLTYALYSDDLAHMMREKNTLIYNSVVEFDATVLHSTFIMEMLTLGVLIIVAICLIAVALVLLNFTIAFTIQEDYREIGIMKGIGVGDGAIKRLYVTKYLYLSLVASLVGFGLSFPVSGILLNSLTNTVVMGTTGEVVVVRVLCALLVVLLTIGFAWIGTRKVQKLTAIQAIRSGSLGERYRRKGLLHLDTGKHLSVPSFLAVNDIMSGIRNYVSLVIALALGVMMVALPANAANTLRSDSANEYFGLGGADVIIDVKHMTDYLVPGGRELILEDAAQLEEDFAAAGVVVDLNYRYAYITKVYVSNPNDAKTITGYSSTPGDTMPLVGLEGSLPLLGNEIALTRIVMDELGVELGDTVHVVVGTTDRPYVITASTETMMQMGQLLNFSVSAPVQDETISQVFALIATFEDRSDIPAQIEALKAAFPSYSFSTPSEYVVTMIGDIQQTITDMKNLILALVLAVDALVVVLLSKTLLARDRGEIALLKSMGLRTGTLMRWQILRMLIVALFALALGLVLSVLLNPVMVRLTFGMMGAANIPAVIIWSEIFVLYPVILIAGTLPAVTLSVLSIRKINKDDFEAIE